MSSCSDLRTSLSSRSASTTLEWVKLLNPSMIHREFVLLRGSLDGHIWDYVPTGVMRERFWPWYGTNRLQRVVGTGCCGTATLLSLHLVLERIVELLDGLAAFVLLFIQVGYLCCSFFCTLLLNVETWRVVSTD